MSRLNPILAVLLLLLLALPSVGQTMRERTETDADLSESDRDLPVSFAVEQGLGNLVDQQTVINTRLVLDVEANEALNRIGERLASVGGCGSCEYTFRILNNPTVNAFATAGGFVYVNSGLLGIIADENELAAVIAHELVHTNESHVVRSIVDQHRKRQAGIILGTAAGYIAGAALGSQVGDPNLAQDIVDIGGELGARAGLIAAEYSSLGFKAELEVEADTKGLSMMRDAGFDPYGFVRLLNKLKDYRESLPPDVVDDYASALLNMKPGLDERLGNVEALVSGHGVEN